MKPLEYGRSHIDCLLFDDAFVKFIPGERYPGDYKGEVLGFEILDYINSKLLPHCKYHTRHGVRTNCLNVHCSIDSTDIGDYGAILWDTVTAKEFFKEKAYSPLIIEIHDIRELIPIE